MNKIELQISRDDLEKEGFENIEETKSISLNENNTGMRHAHFVDPISVIAVISTALLVEKIVDHWLRSQEEGVQVDLRKDPPFISRIAGVPYGFLMVIDINGNVENIKYDYDKRSDLKDVLNKYIEKAS